MIDVSVIIPMFNSERTIKKTVNSVIGQTYKNWELILVDDGSTDNTKSICQQIAGKYENIKYYYKTNGGASSARNKGLDASSGEYVLFLDSDDYIENDTMECILKRIKKDNSDAVFFAMQIDRIKGNNNVSSTRLDYKEDCLLTVPEIVKRFSELFFNDYLSSSCTKLYKNKIIQKNAVRFKETLSMYEDFYFVLEYLQYSNHISIDKRIYYHYIMDITVISINKRRESGLLDNLEIVAKKMVDFISQYTEVIPDEIYKIAFEFYIMYFYKMFVGNYSLKERYAGINAVLNRKLFHVYEKKGILCEKGLFFKVLHLGAITKSSFLIYLIYQYKYHGGGEYIETR